MAVYTDGTVNRSYYPQKFIMGYITNISGYMTFNTSFTIAFWIKIAPLSQQPSNGNWCELPIFCGDDFNVDSSYPHPFNIVLGDSDSTSYPGKIRCSRQDNQNYSTTSIVSTIRLDDDTWHHIVLTGYPSVGNFVPGYLALYIDGTLNVSAEVPCSEPKFEFSNVPLRILGATHNGFGYATKAAIAEVAIWNHQLYDNNIYMMGHHRFSPLAFRPIEYYGLGGAYNSRFIFKTNDYSWTVSCDSGETAPFTVTRAGSDDVHWWHNEIDFYKVSWEIIATESGYGFNLYRYSTGEKLTSSPIPLTSNSTIFVPVEHDAPWVEITTQAISKEYPYSKNNVIANSLYFYRHTSFTDQNSSIYFMPYGYDTDYCPVMPNSNYQHPSINYSDDPVVGIAPFNYADGSSIKYIVNLCRRSVGGLRQMIRRWYS